MVEFNILSGNVLPPVLIWEFFLGVLLILDVYLLFFKKTPKGTNMNEKNTTIIIAAIVSIIWFFSYFILPI